MFGTTNSNSDSSFAVTDPVSIKGKPSASQQQIDKMLEELGVLKGHAFEAFYFIVTEVFMHQEGDRELGNMDDLAKHLNDLTALSKEWDRVKQAFYNGADGSKESNKAFTDSIIDMINDLLRPIAGQVGNRTNDIFSKKPGEISVEEFEEIYKYIEDNQNTRIDPSDPNHHVDPNDTNFPTFLEAYFPSIGSNALTVLDNIRLLGPLIFVYNSNKENNPYAGKYPDTVGGTTISLTALWSQANHDGPEGLPNAHDLNDCVDGLSMNGSNFSSVSAAEEAKLQYTTNQYNQLMAFVKDMLAALQKIKKLCLQNWKAR